MTRDQAKLVGAAAATTRRMIAVLKAADAPGNSAAIRSALVTAAIFDLEGIRDALAAALDGERC